MRHISTIARHGRIARRPIGAVARALVVLAFTLGGIAAASAQGFTLTLQPNTIPSGTDGVAYSQVITAVGGVGPYTFAVTAGSLPTGLTLETDGTLHGTPTASTGTFTVTATDTGSSATGFRPYTFSIGNAGGLTAGIAPASPLPNGQVGNFYSQTITVAGGSGGNVFSIGGGSLPPGLTINSGTGVISGTPTTAGPFNFDVNVIDSAGDTGTKNYDLTVLAALTINPATLPNGSVGIAYNQTVVASGGTGPYTYAVSAGSLPTNLSLDPNTGIISGNPTAAGVYGFTIRATDSLGGTGTRVYGVTIGGNTLAIDPASLPVGSVGLPYNQSVIATGGTGGPYTYSVSAGSLPTGLVLNANTGAITGTPSAGGAFPFTIRAVDGNGAFATKGYTINIGTVSLTVNPATLPPAIMGHSYSQTVTATGGTAPYTFSISAGALPAGLTLNAATGVISGTPTSAADVTFTVMAIDVNGNTGSRQYTFDPRPDPAQDPEVQGLVNAQVAATQRFASAQIGNIQRHLENLHGEFTPCSFNFGITPPTDQGLQSYGAQPNPGQSNPAGGYNPYAGDYGMPPAARPLPGRKDCAADWATSMAFWTAGSFQFGSMTPSGLSNANRFYSGGLTAGVDLRLNDNVIVGAALGYGADRTDVGSNGSRSDASSYSAMIYASLRLYDPLFLDAAAGYGKLGFDNKRWVSGDSTIVSGDRNGSYWFGAATMSLELGRGGVKFAPYVSGDYMSATLGSYGEGGSSSQLLTFQESTFSATSVAAGLRGSIDMPMRFGTLTPNARVEYRNTWLSAYDQSMYYTDLGAGILSTISQPGTKQGATTATLGLSARAPGGLSAQLEYGVSSGSGSLLAQTIRAALRLPF